MKEHEDEVMQSVDKSTVSFDSTGVEDKVVSETFGGKNLGLLTEKVQEQDVMVDVVGSDAVEDDIHQRTEANLEGNSGFEELVMQKETGSHDQVMVDAACSAEDCDASVGIRVLSSEVLVNEDKVTGSGEDSVASVETRVLASEKAVASGSNGDIDVTDSKGTTDDAQGTTDGDCAVNEKIEEQNEVLVSSKVSEDADLVTDVVNFDEQAEVKKLHEKESFNPAIEAVTETVQVVAIENGDMDEKRGKEDEILDSSKIPECLTTVNPVLSCKDADMDRVEDASMDIDGDANPEDDVEHKLLESSSGPVLIQYREEQIKSREPIVYGRRAHVEVPLYESVDLGQKLPESSPVSEDENLKIETDSDSEEDDDNENESMKEIELVENGNLVSLHQSRYFKSPENEGEFSVSDLVWGKIRSHPWWPGQIIDSSNASKKAMKYYKKDSLLIAYFGDHSFAWNNPSVIKPFRANFSENEKQNNTEIFKTAVDSALEEVSRRVELGLACSCINKETYKKIECQVIENAGVAKKLSKRHGIDESASVSSFEPDKLVDYVKLLAQFPAHGDKMDVAITKAQLSSYGRFKGYRELPEFLFCGDLLEDGHVNEEVENNLIENANRKNNIILSDVTDDAPPPESKPVSSSGLKKRKARVSITNGSVKRPNRPLNKVASAPVSTPTPTPKPSFKVGALIQRVASQLTGPVAKVDHGQHVDQTVQTPENLQMEASESVAEMLSQLHLTAQDPMKEYGFFEKIIPFFYELRAAVYSKSLKKSSMVEKPESETKRKMPGENDPEEFEFDFDFDYDDVNDSYWTDRIVQNHSEDQPLEDAQNGPVEEYPVVEHEPVKPAKRRRRSSKKQKQVISGEPEREPEPEPEVEEESEIDRKRRENLATEVVLKFESGINFCSEIQLNKMFKRFGSLMESETEVDRDGGRARVVFKKCFDAEVACNSAGRFNIFGSVNVSYELNYSPLVSYKPLPLPLPLPLLQEDHMDQS